MTIINAQYSTLEEAWGNTDMNKIKKKSSKKSCELYENGKMLKKQKPYRSNTDSEMRYNRKVLMNDEEIDANDYEKFYGYSDARSYSRNTKPLKKTIKQENGLKLKKRVKIDPEENSYQEDDEEDDEDEIEEEEEPEMIYEEVYEEDEDNYLTQNNNVNVEKMRKSKTRTKRRYVEEEDESEREYMGDKDFKSMNRGSTKQVLDLSIYTLSGIILIFMMEQFVQIGIKLKSLK